jgi:hypothetical protein
MEAAGHLVLSRIPKRSGISDIETTSDLKSKRDEAMVTLPNWEATTPKGQKGKWW